MNEGAIRKIQAWIRYVAAVCNWAADAFVSFPKKQDFFKPADGDK